MIRPAEHLVQLGPSVSIDGCTCALLNRLLRLDAVRAQVRGQNPQLDQTLLAIKLAATAFTAGAGTGNGQAPQPVTAAQSTKQLNSTMSTTTAATLLGITDRAIRRAITEKRLAATKVDGRHRITRDDLERYQATRTHTRR